MDSWSLISFCLYQKKYYKFLLRQLSDSLTQWVYWLVMERVSKGRVRDRAGFRQSGSGSGPVFANFESRVRVLHCRVSGFRRVYHLCKKGAVFWKILKILKKKFPFQFYDNFSSNFCKIFQEKVQKYVLKKLYYFWLKM